MTQLEVENDYTFEFSLSPIKSQSKFTVDAI